MTDTGYLYQYFLKKSADERKKENINPKNDKMTGQKKKAAKRHGQS